ncbi:helix-turn-helix transcriptional regulator [Microbacterium sp. 77mftsu3.1]|uniref:helix-turn-helix transcriptional regulator n=1 Tax=Microbacterium sp. 77mftsu3.1 TaxID=1761802 RepID=UPI000887024F|nr:helix-turn-helix transcriptional regulator [Microbacterium sp. 77mftsu3.1]SDG15405.1 Helix-turn-helix domain-containing protein [Microbacterium sp. 77mftsu3.1]SDH31356.1 Helix-turn-helix domain-containing protein [Microbacterium sp. 77mftsu3.1]
MQQGGSEASEQWAAYGRQLGLNLHAARIARGLSQEDVAYGAGLSRWTYQKYERGLSKPGEPMNPRLRALLALAQVLQAELADLLPADPPDLRSR